MKRGRYHARTLIVVAGAALGLLATLVLFIALRQNIESSALDEQARQQMSWVLLRAFIPGGIFVIALSAIIAFILTTELIEPLRDMRAQVRDLARGNLREFDTPLVLSEHAALGSAIETIIADLQTQATAIEDQRKQLEGLLESGAEGLLRVDARGRVLHANTAASQLLKLPPDLHGQTFRSLFRQADLRAMMDETLAGKTTTPVEVAIEDRQLFAVSRPLQNGDAVLVVMDTTELKRLEAVRRDFVANVSHELKTPLTSIRGYAETLLSENLPEETRTQFLQIIHKHAARIQRLVDDLLDLSRLQSGGWHPEIQPVNVGEIAEEAWHTSADGQSKRIQFQLNAPAGAVVAADPNGLRQVFCNLFDNAIRHTPDGGRVEVSLQRAVNGRSAGQIEIRVHDTGSGIPRDAIPRVFERFYRVDPARSRAEGGTGLGLSIVKHLIERMNGEVSADSELGKGTTIRVKLPAA